MLKKNDIILISSVVAAAIILSSVFLLTRGTSGKTVTVKENEICRLFVLPEYQGKGYGRELISFAENEISKQYDKIILHASLPAKAIYLKRGYKEVEFHSLKTENGDYLCYDMMIKQIQNKAI